MSELQYLYGLYLTLPNITQGFIAVIGLLTILIVGLSTTIALSYSVRQFSRCSGYSVASWESRSDCWDLIPATFKAAFHR